MSFVKHHGKFMKCVETKISSSSWRPTTSYLTSNQTLS